MFYFILFFINHKYIDDSKEQVNVFLVFLPGKFQ